ncbi:TonB-dependent receptor [Shewanella avicenniae]|uniref:TonB-dependent receptor n=1 Tax=Shewanella avicenniae TaxID=2814294 RepID=A0ABX7QSI1_9GAMM|nr:TonB-dependent receptor [Shewanella avicenniae]QSX34424.1 TonB-dependent receptor [Shewanella avicenniae]
MKKRYLACLIASTLTHTAWADDDNLERLQVWGTKVTSSSVYVDESAIASKQADHLSDLLREIPGVDVGGTHSLNQRINVRGLDDTDLEILIDGASQNNSMFHHMGNLNINPDILESVDIQVGSNSVVHSGLGGAMEFRTKSARDLLDGQNAFGGRVLLGYNSNNNEYLSFTGYGQLTDSLDFIAYGTTQNRNNFKDGEGIKVLGSDGTISNLMAKLGWDINEQQRLALKYDSYRNHGDYTARPDMGVRTNSAIGGGDVPLYDTHYDRDTISAHYELDFGAALNLRADLYQNTSDLWRDYEGDQTSGTSKNSGLTLIANSALTSVSLTHQFTYGVKWLKIDNDSETVATDGITLGHEQADDLGVFVEDAIDFGNGLIVTPGVRFNHYSKSSATIPEQQSWDNWQTALAAQYALTEDITLHASTTELFKGPQPGEIFSNEQAGKILNPELAPETGRNSEAGIRYNGANVLGADEIRLGFTAFQTQIDDYIEAVDYPLDDCTGRNCMEWDQNIGKVKIHGYEASAFYALNEFSTLVTYASSDSKVHDDGATGGEPLDREVGDSATVTFKYFVTSQDLELRWQWQKTFAEGEKAGYQLHNITAVWEPAVFNYNLNVTLGVENLFDTLYVSHASRTGVTNHPVFGLLQLDDYEPGRNIKLSVAYKF